MVVGIFWNLIFENRLTKYSLVNNETSRYGNCSALNYVDVLNSLRYVPLTKTIVNTEQNASPS